MCSAICARDSFDRTRTMGGIDPSPKEINMLDCVLIILQGKRFNFPYSSIILQYHRQLRHIVFG